MPWVIVLFAEASHGWVYSVMIFLWSIQFYSVGSVYKKPFSLECKINLLILKRSKRIEKKLRENFN